MNCRYWRNPPGCAIDCFHPSQWEATRWANPTPISPFRRQPDRRASGGVDPKLLEILVCPLTRATLSYDAQRQELISRAAKLAYPIRDGVPIMLPEEARRLED